MASTRCARQPIAPRPRRIRPRTYSGGGLAEPNGVEQASAGTPDLRAHASAQGAGRTVTARLDAAVSLLQSLLLEHAGDDARPQTELFRDDDDLYIRCVVRGGRDHPPSQLVAQVGAQLRDPLDSLEISRTPDGDLVGVIQRSLLLSGPVIA